MKKNKAMRLASALLVLTLLTTCAISSTFAKYVTKAEGSDKARVAYWGFNQIAETTIDLFDTTYDDGKVKAANEENVIAPGTKKSTTFAFGYTDNTGKNIKAPEVAYTFKVDVTATGTTTKLDANDNFKWTLAKGDAAATEYNTVEQLVNAIKALSGDASGTKTYQPGNLPADFTSAGVTYTIGWKWDFQDKVDVTLDQVHGGFVTNFDGLATPEEAAQQDAADTELGNMQNLENVELKIAITATQVD